MLPSKPEHLLDPPAPDRARVISMYHPDGRAARAAITSHNEITTVSVKRLMSPKYGIFRDGYGRTSAKSYATTLDATKALKSHLNRRHAEGFLVFDVTQVTRVTGHKLCHTTKSLMGHPDFNQVGVGPTNLAGGVAIDTFWKVTQRRPRGSSSPIASGTPSTSVAIDDRATALALDFNEGRKDAFQVMAELVELRAVVNDAETRVVRAKQLVEALELDVMNAYVNGGSQ